MADDKLSDDAMQQQKDIQFFAAAANAWVNTALEHDRSLMTLSAGAIGLLVGLLSTKGVGNVVLLILYVASMLAFLVCVLAVLGVFRRNKIHVAEVVAGKEGSDQILPILDMVALASFGTGAILTTIIGISTAALSYTEAPVSNERITREGTTELGKSLNNFGNLRPSTGGTPTQAPAPATAPASAPTPAQQSTNSSGSASGGK